MSKHDIIQLFINNLPAIIATFGVIFTGLKILISFNKSVDTIKSHTDYSKLTNDLAVVIQENYELKKQVAENMKENKELKDKLEEVLLKLTEKEPTDDTNRQEN